MSGIAALKRRDRAGWIKREVENPESTAEHCYGVAILAMLLAEEARVDQLKSIKMALIHDLPENKVPDYMPSDDITSEEKFRQEEEAMIEICETIEGGQEYLALWREFEEGKTGEARFVKSLDKLEMMYQAWAYEQEQPDKNLESFWEDIEGFDFNKGAIENAFRQLKLLR